MLLVENIGGLSEATIKTAYLAIWKNDISNVLYGVVALVAIIIMVSKIITVYSKGMEQPEGVDRKLALRLVKQYILYAVFIAVFPFILGGAETSFAEVQDNLKSKYDFALESSVEDATTYFLNEYIIESMKELEDANMFKEIYLMAIMKLNTAIYSYSLYILKYIYFIFCCGRYMWLMMLQLLAPLALILAMSEKTISYFYTWLKNMLLCYLLIPFFILADAFSESISVVISNSFDHSSHSMMVVLLMVLLKINLFAIVTKKTYNLL